MSADDDQELNRKSQQQDYFQRSQKIVERHGLI